MGERGRVEAVVMSDYNASRRFIRARRADLVGILPGRAHQIRGVFLHSTRSGRCGNPLEGVGTENWMSHPGNPGAAYDALIYPDGQQVQATRWDRDEQPLWAAGWGNAGTWSAQQNYIHIEIAQACIDDPFTPEQIESAAQWTAEIFRPLVAPFIERIPFLAQVGTAPYGVADHQHSANGRKLGKSDPGPLWPWADYLARANQLLHEEETMTPEQLARLERLERLLAGNGISTAGDGAVDLTGEAALAYADERGWSAFLGILLARREAAHTHTAPEQVPEHTHETLRYRTGGVVR
jgi:hypothetical protein